MPHIVLTFGMVCPLTSVVPVFICNEVLMEAKMISLSTPGPTGRMFFGKTKSWYSSSGYEALMPDRRFSHSN